MSCRAGLLPWARLRRVRLLRRLRVTRAAGVAATLPAEASLRLSPQPPGADYCFERPGGAAAQDSVIPAAGEPGVKYYYGFINDNPHIKPPQQEITRERFEHAYDNHTSVRAAPAAPALSPARSSCAGSCGRNAARPAGHMAFGRPPDGAPAARAGRAAVGVRWQLQRPRLLHEMGHCPALVRVLCRLFWDELRVRPSPADLPAAACAVRL